MFGCSRARNVFLQQFPYSASASRRASTAKPRSRRPTSAFSGLFERQQASHSLRSPLRPRLTFFPPGLTSTARASASHDSAVFNEASGGSDARPGSTKRAGSARPKSGIATARDRLQRSSVSLSRRGSVQPEGAAPNTRASMVENSYVFQRRLRVRVRVETSFHLCQTGPHPPPIFSCGFLLQAGLDHVSAAETVHDAEQ